MGADGWGGKGRGKGNGWGGERRGRGRGDIGKGMERRKERIRLAGETDLQNPTER